MKVCVCVCVCACGERGGWGGGCYKGLISWGTLWYCFNCNDSLRASTPSHSGSGVGKGRRACNYSCTSRNFEYLHQKSRCKMLIGGDDISNDIKHKHIYKHTDWPKIWRLSRWGVTGELEVEFKFQRPNCKLSFLFPPCRQRTPESLLTG